MESAAALSQRSSRLTWLAVALATGVCALLATVGADARWLAALGATIVRTHSIPDGVPYAAASSAHWVNVPVLGELAFHAFESLGGDRGLLLAQVVAVALAFALLALDMRAAVAPDASRAIVLVAVLFAAAPSLIVARSQLFSLVLFPALLLVVRSEARRRSPRVWLLVPLIALWSNLHGAVLAGLAVAAAYLLLHRLRSDPAVAITVLLASVAALFLTPALARTGEYYVGVLHSEAARRGDGMWAPLSVHAPFDVLFVVVAVPLVMLALRSRLPRWELVCLVALAVSSIHVSRNSVWLAMFIAVPAACGLGRTRLRDVVPSQIVVVACAVVPVLLFVVGIARTPSANVAGTTLRDRAVSLAHGTPILADDADAEQLALDGHRVWIANPLDAFDRRDQLLYLEWLDGTAPGDRVLDRDARVVLVMRDSPSQRRLARDASFRSVGRDETSVLYVRTGTS